MVKLQSLSNASSVKLTAVGNVDATDFYVEKDGIRAIVSFNELLGAKTSGVVINEGGGSFDFRVEGLNDQNLLFTDASADKVGIGTSAPGEKLEIKGSASGIFLNSTTSNLIRWSSTGAGAPTLSTRSAGTKLVLWPSVSSVTVDFGFGIDSGTLWSSVADATASYMHKWYGGTTELMRLQGSGKLMLNATSNIKMTQGITIAQGANDDEILSFKSSDITHGVTLQTEADTFGFFKKQDLGAGGLLVVGVSPTTAGLRLAGIHTTNVTTKSTGSKGAVLIDGFEKGTGTDINATMATNTNILAVRSGFTTRFILDADGDSHQDVGTSWTNFDIFEDDVPLLNALAEGVSRPDNQIREEFRGFLEKHRADLERLELVTFSTDGHHFVNMSRLTMLLTGAVRQLHARTDRLERRIERLESGQGLNPF